MPAESYKREPVVLLDDLNCISGRFQAVNLQGYECFDSIERERR